MGMRAHIIGKYFLVSIMTKKIFLSSLMKIEFIIIHLFIILVLNLLSYLIISQDLRINLNLDFSDIIIFLILILSYSEVKLTAVINSSDNAFLLVYLCEHMNRNCGEV